MLSTAYKLKIEELNSGRHVASPDGVQPSYFVTPWGEKIRRGRVLGTVVEKYIKDDMSYGTLRVDDGTGIIRVKAWREKIKEIEAVNVCDVIDVIGRIAEFEGEIYLALELLRKMNDVNWEIVRDLEIIKERRAALGRGARPLKRERLEPKKLETAPVTHALPRDEGDFLIPDVPEEIKEKIIAVVKCSPGKDGISSKEVAVAAAISLKEAEDALALLLSEGKIFEPSPGKFKSLE